MVTRRTRRFLAYGIVFSGLGFGLVLYLGLYDLLHDFGHGFESAGQANLAAWCYDGASSLRPENSRIWYDRGNARFRGGHFEQALTDYGKAIELEPDFSAAHGNRGGVLTSLGRYQEAIDHFDKAISLHPDFGWAFRNRGTTLLLQDKKKNWPKALEDFTRAIELQPGLAEAYYERGKLHLVHKRLPEALKDVQKAYSLDRNLFDALFLEGQIYFAMGLPRKAIQTYTRLLSLEPRYPNPYAARAQVRWMILDLEGALRDSATALEMYEDKGDRAGAAMSYLNNATVYVLQDRHPEAFDSLKKANILISRQQDAHLSLEAGLVSALYYASARHFDRAVSIGQATHEKIERFGHTELLGRSNAGLGWVFMEKGDARTAIKYCNRVKVTEWPCSELEIAFAMDTLGRAHHRLKDYASSVRCYSKAAKLCDKYGNQLCLAATLGNLGLVYRDMGRLDQAREALRKAREIDNRRTGAPVVYDQDWRSVKL